MIMYICFEIIHASNKSIYSKINSFLQYPIVFFLKMNFVNCNEHVCSAIFMISNQL